MKNDILVDLRRLEREGVNVRSSKRTVVGMFDGREDLVEKPTLTHRSWGETRIQKEEY